MGSGKKRAQPKTKSKSKSKSTTTAKQKENKKQVSGTADSSLDEVGACSDQALQAVTRHPNLHQPKITSKLQFLKDPLSTIFSSSGKILGLQDSLLPLSPLESQKDQPSGQTPEIINTPFLTDCSSAQGPPAHDKIVPVGEGEFMNRAISGPLTPHSGNRGAGPALCSPPSPKHTNSSPTPTTSPSTSQKARHSWRNLTTCSGNDSNQWQEDLSRFNPNNPPKIANILSHHPDGSKICQLPIEVIVEEQSSEEFRKEAVENTQNTGCDGPVNLTY